MSPHSPLWSTSLCHCLCLRMYMVILGKITFVVVLLDMKLLIFYISCSLWLLLYISVGLESEKRSVRCLFRKMRILIEYESIDLSCERIVDDTKNLSLLLYLIIFLLFISIFIRTVDSHVVRPLKEIAYMFAILIKTS